MKTPPLNTIKQLYNQETVLHLVRFHDNRLAGLSREISKLFRLLGDQKELSIWPAIIKTLKKIRFELSTLPLPTTHLITDQLLRQLGSALLTCHNSFPENIEQLSSIIQILADLQEQENTFIHWILTECINNNQKIGLCVLTSKHVQLVENVIKADHNLSKLNLRVMSPRELKNFNFYDRIIFCGSINLFSENQYRNFEFVWRAPRASNLYFLSFQWIRDNFKPEPTFNVAPNRVPVHIQEININDPENAEREDLEHKDYQTDARDINFSPVELILPGTSVAGEGDYDAICDSRLLLLEDGSFIYKEIKKISRIVEFTPQAEINKIENKALEPGMPLIVRTEGSGDSIAAVADMLFGGNADKIRSKQDKWKIAFRKKLFTYETAHEVADALTSLGAPTANEINVRNWQHNDTIKPKKEDDFKAIMAFSGLEDRSDEFWENAKIITQMHIRAGKEISKLLLSRINASKMTDLKKYGRIDIEISGLSGKVSVIMIESVLPDIYQVPASQLDQVLDF